MASVRVFQHEPAEGPGYLGEFLDARGIDYELVRVDRAATIEAGNAAAFVFLGGRSDPHHGYPWVDRERELIRRAADRGLPMLGHGLGAELIAEALGAHVVRNPVRQIGWFEAERATPPDSPWHEVLPARCTLLKWHRQSFELPPGAVRLLKSEWCSTEGFAAGNILALQGHLEVTAEMLRSWTESYAADIAHPSEDPPPESKLTLNWQDIIQGRDKLLLNLERRVEALRAIADRVYGRCADAL